MLSRFAWSMSLRHMRYNIGQTLLTVSIVAISVILLILLNTLTHGIQSRILGAITESMAHITIKSPEVYPHTPWKLPKSKASNKLYVGDVITQSQKQRKLDDWSRWLPRLRKFDPSILAVSPSVESQAILYRGVRPKSLTILGVRPKVHDKVSTIQPKMLEGSFHKMQSGQIVVGKTIADDLALRVGDKLRLVASDGNTSSFTLSGIFRTGLRQMDSSVGFVTLRDAQSLFGMGTSITTISIKLSKIFQANVVADRMQYRVPYEVSSWMRDNKNFLTAMQSQEVTFNLILLLTTIAAGFAIASILIMAVVSKLKELGILKAMGATRNQIIQIFTLQGIFTALFGAVVGMLISVGAVQYLLTIETRDEAGFAQKMFSIVELNAGIVFSAMGIAVLIGFLAALYPAWRAARVNPIDVIRGV